MKKIQNICLGLTCLAALTDTGCFQTFKEDETEKIITTVEKGDTFMDDVITKKEKKKIIKEYKQLEEISI